jgi:hypothetical protein
MVNSQETLMLPILVSIFLGLFAGNAWPHFARGITRERYPSALGNGPVVNFVVGWVGLVISIAIGWWAWPELTSAPLPSALGAAFGLLLIGLFHAGPGAFGRKQ